MMTAQWMMDTKIGSLYVVASARGLTWVGFKKQSDPMVSSLYSQEPVVHILARAVAQLEEYFAGQRKDFDLPLDVGGTDFQRKVWKELSRIPFGKTCSYTELAHRIDNDKAVRAVGAANGKNPIAIIVPCHRVIAADGTLGGYAGGLKAKAQLLEAERA